MSRHARAPLLPAYCAAERAPLLLRRHATRAAAAGRGEATPLPRAPAAAPSRRGGPRRAGVRGRHQHALGAQSGPERRKQRGGERRFRLRAARAARAGRGRGAQSHPAAAAASARRGAPAGGSCSARSADCLASGGLERRCRRASRRRAARDGCGDGVGRAGGRSGGCAAAAEARRRSEGRPLGQRCSGARPPMAPGRRGGAQGVALVCRAARAMRRGVAAFAAQRAARGAEARNVVLSARLTRSRLCRRLLRAPRCTQSLLPRRLRRPCAGPHRRRCAAPHLSSRPRLPRPARRLRPRRWRWRPARTSFLLALRRARRPARPPIGVRAPETAVARRACAC